ncbi:hypothetical protein CUJ88_45415 (plasmid) [Paraburkholderia hospita]|nr:hypothetical protein CUJ88_45415 [Paraburkholderia hospita]
MKTGEDMTMQLHIHLPDNFPLHGIERDAFETKLRNALHDLFDGHRVRQLVDQGDARRAFDSSGVLSLRHIGDEHTFEQCMTLDHCRFEDMSTVLRRMVLNAVGARLGLDLMEPRIAPLPNGEKEDATNRLPPFSPTNKVRRAWTTVQKRLGLAMVLVATAGGAAAWWMARPVAPSMVAMVSTPPARTLGDLTGSVRDDGRPYRISVQVEPQATVPAVH